MGPLLTLYTFLRLSHLKVTAGIFVLALFACLVGRIVCGRKASNTPGYKESINRIDNAVFDPTTGMRHDGALSKVGAPSDESNDVLNFTVTAVRRCVFFVGGGSCLLSTVVGVGPLCKGGGFGPLLCTSGGVKNGGVESTPLKNTGVRPPSLKDRGLDHPLSRIGG